MARIVAAFGSSHSIMLVSQRQDWQHGFREIDTRNPHLYDRDGVHLSYAELLARAPAQARAMVSIDQMGERHDLAQAAMDRLCDRIAAARLDTLIVVGDDQSELFRPTLNPAIAIYHGATITNAKREVGANDNWYQTARSARQEPEAARDYAVDSALARSLIRGLCDADFDIAAMDGLASGQAEGHAFSFIHRRYLQDLDLAIVPVILNTFDPPNQPTPRRCVQLGAALRHLVKAYPSDQRVGLLASGGLSHFVVDEALDHHVLDAIRRKDSTALAALDPRQLQAGSSEIRNWIVVAEAARELEIDPAGIDYIAAYRSPALTGTGLAFASWQTE